ncbi:uncharacterized protein LOC141908357 [Tubulanus polymorphus]|uniref:uncharacterized protein LOC141908357 n=1 Tax=Tubulanus polymorphus TaxID=672921 RepID=UPI003DA513FB
MGVTVSQLNDTDTRRCDKHTNAADCCRNEAVLPLQEPSLELTSCSERHHQDALVANNHCPVLTHGQYQRTSQCQNPYTQSYHVNSCQAPSQGLGQTTPTSYGPIYYGPQQACSPGSQCSLTLSMNGPSPVPQCQTSSPYGQQPTSPSQCLMPPSNQYQHQHGATNQTQYGMTSLHDHAGMAAATVGSRNTVISRSSASSPALTHRPTMHSAGPRASPVPSKHNSDSHHSRHTCTPPPPTYQDAIAMLGTYHQARNDSAYFSFGNNSQSQPPGLISQPILSDESQLVTPVLRRHYPNRLRHQNLANHRPTHANRISNPTREENPEFFKVAPLNCIVFVAGVGTLIIGGASMAFNPYGSFLYAGMWCGASYIALACIASAGVRKKTQCQTVNTLIMAVITLCLCLFYSTWCIVGITQDVKHFASCYGNVAGSNVRSATSKSTTVQYFTCYKLSDADIPPKTPYELRIRVVLESLALFLNLIVIPVTINYILIFKQLLKVPCFPDDVNKPLRLNQTNEHPPVHV